MSSTNKTAKLGLSQFLGTDKPAWLGDYNADMQKIDDAFANLEQGGQSSAADIEALQQKDVDLAQDIADVNDRVDTVSADLIAVGNRTTVLEGNYDTMHHELVLNQESIEKLEKDADKVFGQQYIDKKVYVSTSGNDDNDGSQTAPMKTINGALRKYPNRALSIELVDSADFEMSGDSSTLAPLYGLVITGAGRVIASKSVGFKSHVTINTPMVVNTTSCDFQSGLDFRGATLEITDGNAMILRDNSRIYNNNCVISGTGNINIYKSVTTLVSLNTCEPKVHITDGVLIYDGNKITPTGSRAILANTVDGSTTVKA